ncbi:hypothetical protein EI555_014380 [Monodon monoceros]|uniref:Cytokine receptor-like factor 2 n=1 Tax=Monodon monoceros TaxID=40151 RepID=A0A4U1ESX4_MONMO|nr:hypothetical protein EI555_014380 [Monodon monoceros]
MRRIFLPWATSAIFLLGHLMASEETELSKSTLSLCYFSFLVKPRSLSDLSFQWHQGAVTVTCSDLWYKGLVYEIQHKSTFDAEWQSKEAKTCNVTLDSLDAEKCYFFRARVKTLESSYGSDTYPSDWSEVIRQQRGKLTGNVTQHRCTTCKYNVSFMNVVPWIYPPFCFALDLCQEKSLFPNFILIAGMVTFLIASLLLLPLWKLRRVKKVLMPSVPDPRFTFSGLFESHQGNFQEWIKDTQNVAHVNKMEDGERESIPEEAVVVQLAEMPKTAVTSPVYRQTAEEEATGEPGQLPRQLPQGGEVVSLGDVTFVMSDNSYVMF